MAITGRWSIRGLMVLVAVCAVGLVIRNEIQDRAPVYREIKLLRTGTVQARHQAAVRLGVMGPKAKVAEDALTDALDDPESMVAEAAAVALFKLGVKSPILVRALVKQLETPRKLPGGFLMVIGSPNGPASVLKAMKPPPALLIPLLAKVVATPDYVVRTQVFDVLSDIARSSGNPPPPGLDDALLILLADRKSGHAEQAATVLASLDSVARTKAVRLLMEDLTNLKSDRVPDALMLLARFVPENEAALDILRAHLQDDDELGRLLAIFSFARLPNVARLALPDLARAMTTRDADRQISPFFRHRIWETIEGDRHYLNNEANQLQGEMRQLGPASPLNWAARAVHRMGPETEEAFVRALMGRLDDPDDVRRGRVVTALGAFGVAASEAVPRLVEMAQSGGAERARSNEDDPEYPDEYSTRTLLPSALGQIGASGDARVVGSLVRLLDDSDNTTANNAAIAIDRLGPKAEAAIPALVKALKSQYVPVRRWSASALAKMSAARLSGEAPAILAALDDDDAWVRVRATEALGNIPEKAGPGVRKMIQLLRHLDPNIRQGAIKALARYGDVARPAVPALLAALDDEPGWVRDEAEKTLTAVVPNNNHNAAHATTELFADDPERRFLAAVVLGRAGATVPPAAVSALCSATGDSDSLVRQTALAALGRIGPDADSAAPDVIRALMSGPTDERLTAAYALGRFRAGAKETVPPLIEALNDPDAEVRQAAARAIGTLGQVADAAAPVLIAGLKNNRQVAIRIAIVNCLGQIGLASGVTVPALVDALKDPSIDVRLGAITALAKVGSRSDAAIPALLAALRDEEVASSAGYYLGLLRSDARLVVPELARALKDPSPSCRSAAAYALGAFGRPAHESVLPGLIECLKDPKPRVRAGAAFALQRLGVEAKPAEAALRNLLDDRNQWVRRSAADALQAIKANAAPF